MTTAAALKAALDSLDGAAKAIKQGDVDAALSAIGRAGLLILGALAS